jgi:hypothetical protein
MIHMHFRDGPILSPPSEKNRDGAILRTPPVESDNRKKKAKGEINL